MGQELKNGLMILLFVAIVSDIGLLSIFLEPENGSQLPGDSEDGVAILP